jgi:hypothetical protein
MAISVHVYRYGLKLGTGTMAGNSPTITGYSGVSLGSRYKAVQIVQISGGNAPAKTFSTRVVTDAGATLTTLHNSPHS